MNRGSVCQKQRPFFSLCRLVRDLRRDPLVPFKRVGEGCHALDAFSLATCITRRFLHLLGKPRVEACSPHPATKPNEKQKKENVPRYVFLSDLGTSKSCQGGSSGQGGLRESGGARHGAHHAPEEHHADGLHAAQTGLAQRRFSFRQMPVVKDGATPKMAPYGSKIGTQNGTGEWKQ